MTKIPIRQCFSCRDRAPKNSLTRICFDKDKQKIIVDWDKSYRSGRGLYVHLASKCTKKLSDISRIAKALRVPTEKVSKVDLDLCISEITREELFYLKEKEI
jgi:predicted RNA-binding protein YlxR (DUF448 family)